MRRCRFAIGVLAALGLATLLPFSQRVAAQQARTAARPPVVAPPQTEPTVHLFPPASWYKKHRDSERTPPATKAPFTSTDNLDALLACCNVLGPQLVMKRPHVYLIFWSPNNTITAAYKNLLARFTTDLNNTPFLEMVTQYYDQDVGHIENFVELSGTWTDTATAYPHAGTPADPIQDGDIQNEVQHAINVNSWPDGGVDNLFAVFTERGIESCTSFGCTPLVDNSYCAYHSNYGVPFNTHIYANMPFVNSPSWDCNNTSGQPNSAIDPDADFEISTFSHELFESITDPFPNLTWTDLDNSDKHGGENGDKCAYQFPNPPNADGGTLTLHGNPYNVQPEWSNATMNALGGNAFDGCTYALNPADMDIAKGGPATVYAGATFDYTIDVQQNSGPTAETPHFTDTLDSHVQFVGINKPSGWACTTPPFGSTGAIDCHRTNNADNSDGSTDAGDTAHFDVTARVAATTANGTVVNNTGVIAWDTMYDPVNDSAGNVHLSKSSSTSATVITLADMTISKSAVGAAYAGLDFTYVIDVENNGPSDAQTVNVTDTLPAGTTFVAVSSSGGLSCGGTGPVTCTKATMAAGAIAAITLTVHISPSATGTITNTASVSTTTTDPNPVNNTSSITSTINTQADMSVTKTGPTAPTAGTDVVYTIVATNNGPSDAQNVVMSDIVVAGTGFVSLTQSGPVFACVTPPVGATGAISCTRATLAAGASTTFTLTVHLSPSAANGSQLCDTASVSTTTTDAASGNNASQSCGTVQTLADLALTQTATTAGSPGRGTATFTLTVVNNGPSDSQNITLVATSSLFTGPAPAINASNGGTCTVGVQTVTCTWASLKLGASDVVSITVPYRSAIGSVCDTGNLSAGTPDPNAINNTSTVCISKK